MSSSLSELRNFRLNKANANGASSSTKLATGRKRIRAMSDSSDEEQTQQQSTSTKTTAIEQTTQNGTTNEIKLSVKEKEERYHLFRQIVGKNVDSLILQDLLVHNNWDVQKSYDALQEDPDYKNVSNEISPVSVESVMGKFEHKSPELIKVHKQSKVSIE